MIQILISLREIQCYTIISCKRPLAVQSDKKECNSTLEKHDANLGFSKKKNQIEITDVKAMQLNSVSF